MADHVAELALDKANLTHKPLKVAFSQIRFEGGADLLLMALHGAAQLAEHGNAEIHRQGGSATEKFTLFLQKLIQFHSFDSNPRLCSRTAPVLRRS